MLNKLSFVCCLIVVIPASSSAQDAVRSARSAIAPLKDSKVSGALSLKELASGGVEITGSISGLAPNSTHGFHIHEYGDCSQPDGSSAGAHFMLSGTKHGGAEGGERHLGDLGNLVADGSGVANYKMKIHGISLKGDNSVIGRSFLVHAGTDDLKSDPAGNSGPKIACGVIGVAK